MKKKSADLFKVISKSGGPEHPLKSLAKRTEENEPQDVGTEKRASEKTNAEKIQEESSSKNPLPLSSRGTVEIRKEPDLNETVRQTFLISQGKLETLKNIVYHKKISGNIYTTQQDILEEAIDALVEKLGEVPDRPEEEKKREQQKKRGRKRKS